MFTNKLFNAFKWPIIIIVGSLSILVVVLGWGPIWVVKVKWWDKCWFIILGKIHRIKSSLEISSGRNLLSIYLKLSLRGVGRPEGSENFLKLWRNIWSAPKTITFCRILRTSVDYSCYIVNPFCFRAKWPPFLEDVPWSLLSVLKVQHLQNPKSLTESDRYLVKPTLNYRPLLHPINGQFYF